VSINTVSAIELCLA